MVRNCDKHPAAWVTYSPCLIIMHPLSPAFNMVCAAAGHVSFRRLSTPEYSSKMVPSAKSTVCTPIFRTHASKHSL